MADLLFGFVALKDVVGERVGTQGVETLNNAIDVSLQQHTAELDAMFRIWCAKTTKYTERHKSIVHEELQMVDEFGRALPTKGTIYQTLAYPLFRGATALGLTYEARQKITVQELNDLIAGKTEADARTMKRWLLSALFDNVGYTFTDEAHGDLVIKGGLANSDADLYLPYSGGDEGATDEHYLFQAAAIDDTHNPFPTIREELMEHPENGGEVIAFIPPGLNATVTGLADFIPVGDPHLRQGANATTIVGGPGVDHPGKLLGRTNEVWVAEWRSTPANYIEATTTGGEPALAFREDETESLRGFKRVAERDDHPYYESQYLRKGGFAGRNRINGVVMKMGAGSYIIPSGYALGLV